MNPFIIATLLLAALPAAARSINTTCNLRYNNMGVVHGNVPCSATFAAGRLQRVAFTFPTNRVRYDWTVGQPGISGDPRWMECVRHTATNGNQWQVCTAPSPQELGL